MKNNALKLTLAAVLAFTATAVFDVPTAFGMSRVRHVPVAVDPSPLPSATAAPSPSPVPSPIGVVVQPAPMKRISVANIVGAEGDEIEMIHRGEMLANAMLDTPCFKQWVLAANYTENNDMTQPQVYGLVTTQPSRVDVEMYTGDWWANHKWRTVGFENDPFDGVVHMNRYFVRTAEDVADNIIHEDRGHSLGFHHYGSHATSEPYGMNYAYEGCAQQRMQARGAKNYRPPGIRLEVHKRGRRFLHDFGKKSKTPHRAHSK